jgi:hypothetical protein
MKHKLRISESRFSFSLLFYLFYLPHSGLWIRIHFLRIRIRIQSLMLEANTDSDPNPDPDPDQGL